MNKTRSPYPLWKDILRPRLYYKLDTCLGGKVLAQGGIKGVRVISECLSEEIT